MIPAALIAILAVAVGTGIGLASGAGGRAPPSLHTFALVTAVAVVLGQLLPDAVSALGLPALLIFAVGFGLPRILEWVPAFGGGHGHGHGHGDGDEAPCSDVGLELSFAGFLLHRIGDGMGLSLYSSGVHAGHGHYDVILAIAGHTVPVTALVTMAYRARRGTMGALLRMGLVVLATGLGMALTGSLDAHTLAAWEPWIEAAVAGLLMHVVTHGWQRAQAPTLRSRITDFLAIGTAVGLVVFGGHSHAAEHGIDLRADMAAAMWELGLETAPMLLLGLLIAALLQTFGGRLPSRWLRSGGRVSQVSRGALLGAPLPICACGILPVAHSLRARGGSAALVVAFLLSTPELGVETFALTTRFLGLPFALIRLGAALLVAMAGAYVLSRAVGERLPGDSLPPAPVEEPPLPEDSMGWVRRVAAHFDDLLYHVGAWTLVGLLAAAYVQAAVGEGALRGLVGSGLDIVVVSLLAVPSYVCASSATPLAAVLLHKGLSPGAVLAGLLLGPATNLATVGFLRRSFGGRAAAVGLAGVVLCTWLLAALTNAYFAGEATLPEMPAGHAHGPLALAATALLLLMMTRAVWVQGLRAWMGSLTEGFDLSGHGHGHAHAHGHGHGHDADPAPAPPSSAGNAP